MSDLTLYNAVRDQIQTGDWIGWKTPKLLGFGIRFWQRFWYGLKEPINHVAIVKKQQMGGQERVFILESMGHGLQLRLLSERLFDAKGEAYLYKLKPLYDPMRPTIGLCIDARIDRLEEIDDEYDLKGCLANWRQRAPKNGSDYYCSEMAYIIHEEACGKYYELCQGRGPAKAIMRDLLAANKYLCGASPMPGDTPKLGFFEEKGRIL